jgi:hypothetical protein
MPPGSLDVIRIPAAAHDGRDPFLRTLVDEVGRKSKRITQAVCDETKAECKSR